MPQHVAELWGQVGLSEGLFEGIGRADVVVAVCLAQKALAHPEEAGGRVGREVARGFEGEVVELGLLKIVPVDVAPERRAVGLASEVFLGGEVEGGGLALAQTVQVPLSQSWGSC